MHGIVMDIKNGKAVVFKKNGDIIKINDKNYTIGQTVNIAAYPYRKIALTAACFILTFVTGISGYAVAYKMPSDYIYMDINPSMRIDVNCFNKVVSVVPLNDEAEELAKSYSLNASDTEQCIDNIVLACREKEYLNSGSDIEFNIVTNKSKLNDCINTVSEKLKSSNYTVSVQNIDKAENSRAMKYRTSPKRLKAVDDYTKVFGGTPEDNFAALKGVTSKEIYDRINAGTGEDKADKKYKSSPERLDAVRKYTDTFGGTLEENMEKLRGIGTQEINSAAENNIPILKTDE